MMAKVKSKAVATIWVSLERLVFAEVSDGQTERINRDEFVRDLAFEHEEENLFIGSHKLQLAEKPEAVSEQESNRQDEGVGDHGFVSR